MNPLHKSSYDADNLESSEGQRELLCSNKASLRCPSLDVGKQQLSNNTLCSLEELSDVLKNIHRRMIAEGYNIVDGVIHKHD